MPASAQAPSILPTLAPAIVIVAGVAFLIFLRTRRVACPATCRRCGYDVSRRPADSTRCSECGADLNAPRAIRRTRRVPAPRTTAVTLLLIVVSASIFVLRARRFDWTHAYLSRIPDDWVAHHAERGGGTFAADAFDEWLRRYRAMRLSPDRQERFHDHLLDWQSDLARPWDPKMGDLLLAAVVENRLSAQRRDRFLDGTLGVGRLRTRPAIRVGDPVVIQYDLDDRTPNGIRGVGRMIAASFRGPPEADSKSDRSLSGGWSPGPFHVAFAPQEVRTTALSPGRHTLHVALWGEPYAPTGTKLSRTPTIRKTFEVDVLPKGTPLGQPIPNPGVAIAVAGAVRLGIFRRNGNQLFAQVGLTPAPVDRAFDVYVEQAGRRYLIARRCAPANATDPTLYPGPWRGHVEEYIPLEDPADVGSLRVVLVGSGEPLRDSADLQKYWAGTIVFPEVPIQSSNLWDAAGLPLPKFETLP